MIVMDPDEIARLDSTGDLLRKDLVDTPVGGPGLLSERYPRLVVKDRPENRI
jgi:hypothetical protein